MQNPNKKRVSAKKYRERNRDTINAKQRELRARHLRLVQDYERKTRYKISVRDYDKLFKNQNGLCAICGKPETQKHRGKTREIGVDHCHLTNKIRGILCAACNNGISRFKDSPTLLRNAAIYLERNQ